MDRYRITSFGADVVISKKMINLVTSEYVDQYMPLDYFATPEEFSKYVDLLISERDKMNTPECWKYED